MPQIINAPDCDLAATLFCGQAFRWSRGADGWFTGIVDGATWRLRPAGAALEFRGPRADRLRRYLALDRSLADIVATFPDDPPLRRAVARHWGLRVLRQDPWETLASYIASSTKQIVQIRQIVAALAARYGERGAFPRVEVVARASLAGLRACRLGFRAPRLRAAARAIESGRVRLADLPRMDYERALAELQQLDGVGEKIAACTLLFGCGFDQAFPVDVWVARALRRLYFAGRPCPAAQLRRFAREHFGPQAGWAQQYLFFDERTRGRQPFADAGPQG